MLDGEDEWVVYRTALTNGRGDFLHCESRADWDEWEARYRSGNCSFPDFEKVELVATGLTETVARDMVHMSRH